MNRANMVKFLPLLIFTAAVLLLPVFTRDPYVFGVFTEIYLWVIVCLGLQVLMGTGLASVAQAAFMGVGAYTSVLLVVRLGWNYWIALPLAGVVAAIFALLIGLAVLRIKGVYFFIVTMGFALAFNVVAVSWVDLTRGTLGFSKIPPPSEINLGFTTIRFGYANLTESYYLVLAVCLVVILVAYRLVNSRIGFITRSIGEADVIAEHVGVNTFRYKILAFVICCAFAGVAGSLRAEYLLFVSSGSFPISDSIYAVMYAVVGGYGSVGGGILGPLVLVGISKGLTWVPAISLEYVPLFYGVILLAVIRLIPEGLVSVPRVFRWGLRPRSDSHERHEGRI